MTATTAELHLELTPSARVDLINVTERVQAIHGDILASFPKALYCSFHTTAGYFDERFCTRLNNSPDSLQTYLRPFQHLFPPDGEYRHDQLHLRSELTDAQRVVEPRNADSHLTFIGSGLENCVTYHNRSEVPVYFVDLDGVNDTTKASRRRKTTVVGFNTEEAVADLDLVVPVSKHGIDSVNLRSARLGIFDQLQEAVAHYGIEQGWIEITLAPDERHTALTVNEYETLLMRYDLVEVLRDPLRFMAEKGRNMLRDPRAIPNKARNYAKYDLVQVVNQALERLGLSESVIERIIDKVIALPAAHHLRMRRSMRFLISSEKAEGGTPQIRMGRYQSPILVQWGRTGAGGRRVHARLYRLR